MLLKILAPLVLCLFGVVSEAKPLRYWRKARTTALAPAWLEEETIDDQGACTQIVNQVAPGPGFAAKTSTA